MKTQTWPPLSYRVHHTTTTAQVKSNSLCTKTSPRQCTCNIMGLAPGTTAETCLYAIYEQHETKLHNHQIYLALVFTAFTWISLNPVL